MERINCLKLYRCFCFPQQVEILGHVLHMNNNLVIPPSRSQIFLGPENLLNNYVLVEEFHMLNN